MDFDFQVLGEVEKGRTSATVGYTVTATPSKNVRISHLVTELMGAEVGQEITAFAVVAGTKKAVAITKALPTDVNKAKLTAVSKENPDLIQFSHSRLWGSLLEGSKDCNVIWTVNQTGIEKNGRTFFLLENPERVQKVARQPKKKGDTAVTETTTVDDKAEAFAN